MPSTKRYNELVFPEQTAPGTPDAGFVVVYAKADGKVYRKDDAGTETELGGGSGPAEFDLAVHLAFGGR